MAVRGSGSIRLPSYCAEHSHKIPSFERAADKVARLEDYATLYEYDERNLARATRVVAVAGIGAGVLATAAVSAAPAIGGLISSGTATLTGGTTLYGAAAASHGLALLGGGAASGGALAFGVTGGTCVVTVVGAALGGALGTSITNAYLSAACGTSLPGWPCDKQLDELRNVWLKETNPAKRKVALDAFHARAFEALPYISVGQYSPAYAARKEVKGSEKLWGGLPLIWNLSK